MESVYLILFICYASYAYNRKSVVFSMPMLKEEVLDASDAGLILSCQNIAFSIGKFLVGILSDRLNPNVVFATGLLISGCATVIFSFCSSVTTFCCLWIINGLSQGCGWPSIAKIIRQRASPSQFGTLWSFMSCSSNFSGSLGPMLSAFILVRYGWRWNIFIAGFLTLSLLGVFLLSLTCLPGDPKPNKENEKSSATKDKSQQITVLDLFKDPFILVIAVSYMVVFCARTTTVDWGQLYLMEEKNHSQYTASAFTSSVEIGGFVGGMAAGYLTDWVIKRNMNSKQGNISKPELRLSVGLIFLLGSVIFLHLFRSAIDETSSAVMIMFIGALMGMSYYGPVAIFGIVASESVPSHVSGASDAIVSLFGNIGAVMSGLPFCYIAKLYQWSGVFLMLEFMAAGTLLMLVRCRKMTPKIEKAKVE